MTRTRRPLAALAMVALMGAGCSKSSSDSGTAGDSTAESTATTTIHELGVKFAVCMRDNGIEDFPDPDASGALTIEAIANGSSVDTSTAAFEQALSARTAPAGSRIVVHLTSYRGPVSSSPPAHFSRGCYIRHLS